MRSAVSAILSEPSDQPPMAFPDYAQVASDHRRALILVTPLGSRITTKLFQRVFEKITKVHRIPVSEGNHINGGKQRHFHTRYTSKPYPVENNDWGDFQYHRSLLGIITVGGYSTTQELSELTRLHEATKVKYSNTLLDTRLIAIGINAAENGEHNSYEFHDENIPPTSIGSAASGGDHSKVLFYQSSNFEDPLESDLTDFLTHLFEILDSKRRDFSREKPEGRLPFLCAPFEKKDFVGLDLESRTNKKRTFGRQRKHLADICLLCDALSDAHQFYEAAADILKSCNDWIWLAGALEGICAITVITLYPRIQRTSVTTQRNSSYSVVSSVGNNKTMSINNGKSYLNGEELSGGPKNLSASDLLEKYREIVSHYGKYRHAGMIETEASIKAVQVLSEQKNYLTAAEFLQNIVFINLQINDEEKIQRFSALSNLYRNIGFHRKAAFFLRVAAMRCVAPQNQHPDWNLCYNLLLKTSSGYQIDLNNAFAVQKQVGWPALQIQVLQELAGTARRMGNHAASVHHMTFLLEHMFDSLTPSERQDFCSQLAVITAKAGGAETPVVLESGLLLPPIGLYKVPRVTSFELLPLAPNMEPKRSPNSSHQKKHSGVFVFTPIQFGAKSTDPSLVPFKWVQGDVAEVCLTMYNPLPSEVKLVNLALLHEGIEFESFPTALSLSPSSGPLRVSLVGMPKGNGQLKILGYSCSVFGVKSSCKLSKIKTERSEFTVTVLPSLPQLGAKIFRRDHHQREQVEEEEDISPTDSLQLYDGESAFFDVSLTNVSGLPASNISVTCTTVPTEYSTMCSIDHVGKGTVLDPGESMAVKVTVKARRLTTPNMTPASTLNSCDTDSIGKPWRIFSRLDPTRWSGASKKSNGSDDNKGRRGSVVQAQLSTVHSCNVTVNLKITYTGGPGGTKGYQRELVKSLTFDVVPSLEVTKCDVLPADKVNENFLILDVSNHTEHEIDLKYSPAKILTIEQGESCRIPVPVTKFAMPSSNCPNAASKQKYCSEYLQKVVQLEWNLTRLNRTGFVSLHDVAFDADMISNLEHCPVEWSVRIDGASSQDFVNGWNVNIGQSFEIEAAIRNDFDFTLRGDLRIDFCLQGQRCTETSEAMVLVADAESEAIAFPPGDYLRHVTSLLPLAAGSYDIVISCNLEKTLESSFESAFTFTSTYPKINLIVNEEIKT